MKIAIYGTGGVGGYFGARLAQVGEDVTFIARGEHLESMLASGLRIESSAGDFTIQPVKATDDPRKVGEVDLVVVGVKAWQVPDAARAIRPMIGAAGTVLPLQNGVEAADQLSAELGRERVLGGLCRIVSFVVGPGHIRHAGFEPSITIGELDNKKTARLEKIQQVLLHAGLKTTVAADFQAELWSKFLFIAAFSGVGALHDEPVGVLRANEETRIQLHQAMDEIYQLATTRGIAVPVDTVARAMAAIDGLPPDATSSMQRDIAAGRPAELESQTGAVVRMAHDAGLRVPLNEMIYAKLKAS